MTLINEMGGHTETKKKQKKFHYARKEIVIETVAVP